MTTPGYPATMLAADPWPFHGVALSAIVGLVLTIVTIPWVLTIKREATSAVAWCLLVFFLPYVGSLLFLIFGYQHVQYHLGRKRRHKRLYRATRPSGRREATPGGSLEPGSAPSEHALARLARLVDAFPATTGNRLDVYDHGATAYAAMQEAIDAAEHHIHLQSFIFQPDASGHAFLEQLTRKARAGVEVRLLYDAMGSYRLHRRLLRPLIAAGGQATAFLPLNPLRRRLQINMRNHRKILVVDGQVAFTGGLNVGDEYLGQDPRFGPWRDTHVRLEGPAVAGLQYVFAEDWNFAAEEPLRGAAYFPEPRAAGTCGAQIVYSGPDQEQNAIREVYFAAILQARRRLWIASPYFVPDAGLLDALRLAAYLGVDVRLLCQYHPDKWIPFFAARYYFADVLRAGVRIYQYAQGMMHSKVLLVDGEWASVGTANLDNRSLHLNFEVNCLVYDPHVTAELERAFESDLRASIRLRHKVFSRRPFAGRLVENGCRLLSPVL